MWIIAESNTSMQHKCRHFCFYFFVDIKVIFFVKIHLNTDISITHPFLVTLEVLELPNGGNSYDQGRCCPSFWSENWVCVKWAYTGGLGLLMGSHVGYRVYGYFLFRCTSIDVPFPRILQIEGPSQGASSFSYPGMKPCTSSQKERYSYHLFKFTLGWPLPCSILLKLW